MAMLYKGRRPAVVVDSDIGIQEEGGVSSESMTNVCSCNSGPPLEDDSSDTSLKLGYAIGYPNQLQIKLHSLPPCGKIFT